MVPIRTNLGHKYTKAPRMKRGVLVYVSFGYEHGLEVRALNHFAGHLLTGAVHLVDSFVRKTPKLSDKVLKYAPVIFQPSQG